MIQMVDHRSLVGWRQGGEISIAMTKKADNTHKMYSEREEGGMTETEQGYKTFWRGIALVCDGAEGTMQQT